MQVYIALEELGWRPSVQTWINKTLPAKIPDLRPEMRAYIFSLFDAHVDAGLTWLAKHGKFFIDIVENNITSSLCALMQVCACACLCVCVLCVACVCCMLCVCVVCV